MVSKEDELLIKEFEAETGKNAIWRGKITQIFKSWKEKQKNKTTPKSKIKKGSGSSDITQIRSDIQDIVSKLNSFDHRLSILENEIFPSKKKESIEELSPDHFLRILKTVYNSIEKKFGDFVSIYLITENIKQYLPWSTAKIHSELYKLFMNYKIDLQPGKRIDGEPLIQDGNTFVWFKLK